MFLGKYFVDELLRFVVFHLVRREEIDQSSPSGEVDLVLVPFVIIVEPQASSGNAPV